MLTQVATVKARLGLEEADVKDDALLEQLVKLVSARFDKEANRTFGYNADASEEFSGSEMEIRPACIPIADVSFFELKTNEADGWENAVADYLIRRATVISLSTPLGTDKQQGRVNYSGGYVLPGGTAVAEVPALPDDIEQSCIDQVVYLFQNKDRLGIASMSGQGGSLTKDLQSVVTPATLLPAVQQVLKKYERWVN
ncbi:MAG: hypothetical protein H7Y43_04400 [Akkermansiaceae bacterium]|nr:hypothetical protein [Verrucomicrobiales bacterium]